MPRAAYRVLRLLPSSAVRLAVVLLAVAGLGGSIRAASADSTEAKIRLMSEALRARDAGDLPAAQKALVQLIALAPNDEAARRLRNEIEAQAIAQQAALTQQAAARQAAEERAAVEAVRRTYAAPEPVRPAAPANPAPVSAPVSDAPLMIDVRLPEPGQTTSVPPVTEPVARPPVVQGATSVTLPAPDPARPLSPRLPSPVVAGPLAQKLGGIVLPEVEFNRTSLEEAVAWLSRASAQNDQPGASPRGVNIALIDPARRNPPVTLSLRAVTVKRALDFMTESVGFTYEVQDDAVVVRPGIETARMEEARPVEIEARFVEVSSGMSPEAAATWEMLRRLAPDGSAVADRGSFRSFVGEFDVTALVRTLTQQRGSTLLAAPAATVLSGQPATMAVMQDVRYPAGYKETPADGAATVTQSRFGATSITIKAAPPQDFASRRVGAEMDVTASVGADDRTITLDLRSRLTAFERFVRHAGATTEISGGAAVKVQTDYLEPLFSVREIATRVKIPDGYTLVLGGLNRERVEEVDRKVPLLGDIPGLGLLFRVKGERKEQRELLIFITARVVKTAR